jgi:uncharacterized pyridoxamine 5'-phosphate oxidase family protein
MMDKETIKKDVYKFLQENSTAVVATSFKDTPKAATVYFVVDEALNFYFITKRKTSKYLNAELNPNIAIVVGTGPEHITVQAGGRAELIVDSVEKERIMNLVVGKQRLMGVKLWPIDELKNLSESHKVVFKFITEELYYMNLDSKRHPETISDELIKII